MLLQTNQYVLLCDMMGHAAQPFELFLEPRRQPRGWKSLLPQAGQAEGLLLCSSLGLPKG